MLESSLTTTIIYPLLLTIWIIPFSGFQQVTQPSQYMHWPQLQYVQTPSMQPACQFGGKFGDPLQQQPLSTQPHPTVQNAPPIQQYYANPQPQQPYQSLPTGQFTGQSQGMHARAWENVFFHSLVTEKLCFVYTSRKHCTIRAFHIAVQLFISCEPVGF